MATKDNIEITGLVETQEKLEQVAKDLVGEEMLQAMKDATLLISRGAKVYAPVDTGRLRASITPEIRVKNRTVQGVVGSNLNYAPYMEIGTGVFGKGKRHNPPAKYLEQWARRHKTSAALVALAISKRGGLKGRKFLQKSFDDNKDQVIQILSRKVTAIINK